MKYVAAIGLLPLVLVTCCASSWTPDPAPAPVPGEVFTHPAYAYSIEPPEGYAVRPFVDDLGVPYYVLTDDKSSSPHAIRRGIWIIAFPIPSDDQLDAAAITPLITALISFAEPGLKISAERTPGKIGGLDAVSMSVAGQRRAAGAWRGRLHVAVQGDNYLVVHHGSPPGEYEALRPVFEKAIGSMVAPLPIKPIRSSAEAKPLTDEEARLVLKQCTPRVQVLARKDVKDSDTLNVDIASGTGFLVHPAGYVITNRHVVESNTFKGLARLCYDRVNLHFDKSLKIPPQPAQVIAVSHQWDLALLKIDGDRTWPTVRLADPSRIRTGHKLLVAGWPEPSKYGKDKVTIRAGKVLGVDVDSRNRPRRIRHDAFTRPGSSGGPVFDLNLGAIVATHYMAYTVRGLVNGVWQDMPGGFKGGVPVSRLLWEFPQVAAHWKDRAKDIAERRALVAYFLLQERFGAAFIEAKKALARDPKDGLTNAYVYRMYALQRDTERAQESLLAARRKPESSYRAVLFAAQSALETGDVIESSRWNAQAYQMAPTHPASHLGLVRSQVAMGRAVAQFAGMAQNALGGAPHPELEMLKGIGGVIGYLKSYAVIKLPPRQPPAQQVLIDSIVALEKSIELWPARQGLSWSHLAILHAVDGRKKKARTCRERALRSSPNDVFTRLSVAHLDLLQGDYRSARRQISEANQIRSLGFGLFLTGWANMLEAKELAAKDRNEARRLVALGRAQIGATFRGPERHLWWRSYAASVSSDLLRR